jgi:hypothetical protein
MIRLYLTDKLRAVAASGPLSIKEREKSTQAGRGLDVVFHASYAKSCGCIGPRPTIDRRQRRDAENLTIGARAMVAARNRSSP